VARLCSPTTIWASIWLLATLINGAIVISDQHLDQPFVVKGSVAIVAQLAATVALLAWLGPVPTTRQGVAPVTSRRRLTLAITLAVVVLFSAGAAGLIVLVPIGVAAGVVLAILRPRPSVREIGFALALSLLAMAGGLLDWLASGRTSDLGMAAQLPLVVLTLLARWAIANRVGWVPLGIGPTTFLTSGAARALRDFGLGLLLAVPWALGYIAKVRSKKTASGPAGKCWPPCTPA